ncbi:MAG: hypothetical protein Q9198_006109, partial [Flavoplaca austrocitrina]
MQKKSLTQGNSLAQATSRSNDLSLVATKCFQTAQDLQAELDSLRTAPGSGLRVTIKATWFKKKKAKKIGKLKLALNEYEKTLDSTLLVDVHQTLDTLGTKQESQSKTIVQQLSKVSADLQSCQSNLANRFRSEIDRYIAASEAQHVVTRQHVNAHITRTMQGLSLSQEEKVKNLEKQQQTQRRCDQFVSSFWFSEMHARMNDVEEPHADTFHWIFEDDDTTRPWNSFSHWLREGTDVYWINGKAGSGKSTLVKFLIEDPRTKELFGHSTPGHEPFLIRFYLWLSGTIMQRSLKGLLCSMLYQIFHESWQVVEDLLLENTSFLSKRVPGDWSKQELQTTLLRSIEKLNRPLCIFLDGLDEFDQDNDVDQLLNLVEDISRSKMTKICVSSRPEHYIEKRLSGYKQLRLQDLTARDMTACIRTALEVARDRCLPASFEDKYLERIIETISNKADGVFLWVHYALTSLVRGMRSEDSFDDLLQRIKQLPSGMHQLYLQMWNRLNEDKQQYQKEAATYFSYKARESECNLLVELSLFELLVALDPQLQSSVVNDFKPQDPLRLARQCEALRPRVLTRTAGLLEFVEDVGEKKRYRSQGTTKTSASAGNLNYTNDLGRCQSKQNCQSTSVENDFT